MHYDDNRFTWFIVKSLSFVSALALCAAICYSTGETNAIQRNAEETESGLTKVVMAIPKELNFATLALREATMPSTLPLSSTQEMESVTQEIVSSVDDAQPECAENVELVEEPIPERDHPLYYVVEDGIRTDIPVEYQDYVWNLLKEYGHEDQYELVLAMIYHESGYNISLVSKTNDYGLMQINQCNHKWLRETLGITNFLDPYQSIDAGVYMISKLFDKYDAEQALVCYNMGEGGALRKGITSSKYSRGVFADVELLVELES